MWVFWTSASFITMSREVFCEGYSGSMEYWGRYHKAIQYIQYNHSQWAMGSTRIVPVSPLRFVMFVPPRCGACLVWWVQDCISTFVDASTGFIRPWPLVCTGMVCSWIWSSYDGQHLQDWGHGTLLSNASLSLACFLIVQSPPLVCVPEPAAHPVKVKRCHVL